MRKIIGLGIFFVMIGLFLGASVESVKACVNWCVPVCMSGFVNPDGSCRRYETACCDSNPIIGSIQCNAGYYACNLEYFSGQKCCKLGTTTPTCFVPGTIVSSPGGDKKIEDIKVGDEVSSFANDKILNSSVSQIYKAQRDFYFDLAAGEYEVKVTAEHPFYIGSGKFEQVQNLKVGDRVYVEGNGGLVAKQVTSNTRIDEKTDVYNMSVDNTNTYFANGFGVHNKGGDRCRNGTTFGPDCPPGTEIDPNSGVYIDPRAGLGNFVCYDPGTSQADTSVCADWYYPPSVCGPKTCCRTNKATGKCSLFCQDCTEEAPICRRNLVLQYACISNCTAVSPSATTLSFPADGASVSTTTVALQWNTTAGFGTKCPAPNSNTYEVYVKEGAPPTASVTDHVYSGTSVTAPFTGLVNKTYYWMVGTSNGGVMIMSAIRSFTIQDVVAGKVYYDAGNTCSSSQLWNQATSVSVLLDGVTTLPVTAGLFSTNVLPLSSHTLAVNIPNGYTCSTTLGCDSCALSGVMAGSINNYFYLTTLQAAWWQTEGAGVYAGSAGGGTTISSTVPSTITANNRYLIIPGAAGATAALLRASGAAAFGSGDSNSNGWSAKTTYKGKKMDYAYFAKEMGLLSTTAQSNLSTKPAAGQDFYYKNGSLDINGGWSVLNGESYTVFVNGDLDITSDITVANGGFLAIFVNGDINIAPDVATIQGLYVADDNFVTQSVYNLSTLTNDIQLDAQGSIAAWGTFSLARNLGGGNGNAPGEKFTYRTDLLTNMPEKMKAFVMQWSEVVPGTYEDQ